MRVDRARVGGHLERRGRERLLAAGDLGENLKVSLSFVTKWQLAWDTVGIAAGPGLIPAETWKRLLRLSKAASSRACRSRQPD